MEYVTRYLNTCQGDPIIRHHRTREACERYARRMSRSVAGDGYAHDYRGEELDEDGRIIAIYPPYLGYWQPLPPLPEEDEREVDYSLF